MQPRQIARATSFGPDAIKLISKAFDNAWSEIAPRISTNPIVVEAARTSLATLVLGLANADSITADGLKTMAVAVFCAKYRIEVDEPAMDLRARLKRTEVDAFRLGYRPT